MPDGLRLYEQATYTSLRNLYGLYHRQAISKEQAAKEKRLITAEYEKQKNAAEFLQKRCEHSAKLWKEIEAAASRFARERTVEAAEDFVQAVYGVGLKPARGEGSVAV